jgi:isopentenyl diphosphate isomerase/L-lactate dehydrogenase-like FMN-dependent dehydrogenase
MQDENPEQIADKRLVWAEPDFQVLHEIVAKARQNLNQNDWDYIVGAAETETTLRRNRFALDSIGFRPRVLRDVSHVDATVTALGRQLRLPIVLAPVGSLESFHDGAAASVVRAAGRFGVAHMLSSVCDPGLEKVAEAAPETARIFQLYVRGDESFVDDHVARAIACGYTAFCMTIDTAIYSRRERDLAKRHVVAGRRRASGREFQALKGIATVEDARIALDHGVDWIYVSNHGGRQLDHGRGSMEVLPEIVEAVAGRAGIIVDGGFARGTDVVKALAAGANLVGLGRMQCYALAAGGENALVRMLELLEDEVQRCLGLLGVTKFAELDRSYLHATPSVTVPHVLSAFPLLKIDDYRY